MFPASPDGQDTEEDDVEEDDGDSQETGAVLVLILNGNSEIGAHIGRILCCLICARHLIRSGYHKFAH